MDLGLAGKKAVVTGATRGIGLAIAEQLAGEGCDVGICARGEAAIPPTLEKLKANGVNAVGHALDITVGSDLRGWIAEAAGALGGLDIVIANVSGFGLTNDEAGWREGFESDVLGTFNAVDAAMPFLEKSDAGAIVGISSSAAVEYFGGVRPYNSIKATVINYLANLAIELAPKNIRANTVSPGTIYFTGGVWHQREQNNPEVYNWALGHNPMGRMGSPLEVARAVTFLASPAASFITGANLMVDGGITRRVQY